MPRINRLFLCLIILLLASTSIWAQSSFTLKSAPEDLNVYLNNELIRPVSSSAGHRVFRIANEGMLRFSAEGYTSIEYHSEVLPSRNRIVGIKLENERGIATYRAEYPTGVQPKSAYFTPDGQRLVVPLLAQHGIDVFQVVGGFLRHERRLTVPGSRMEGFVEALFDERRREMWVSNMLENKVHIYDMDTLEYKMGLNTVGVFPKVIVQSPDGKLTITSNWITHDLSVFDSDTKRLLRRIPVGCTPRGMAFSPDGNLLYVCNYDGPFVEVVDMTQNRVVNRFRLHNQRGAVRHIIYRDGLLYISDMALGSVFVVEAATGTILRSTWVGPNINTIILTPDGRYVIAASRGVNNPVDYTRPGPDFGAVYILNANDLSLKEKIWGRNQPTGVGVSPDGKLLVFTDFLDQNLELYWLDG